MKTETLGTVVGGLAKARPGLNLPDESRVRVAVQRLQGGVLRPREGWGVCGKHFRW